MIKSIFAKYVITFMALLLVSFLLLFLIVNSVVRNDSLRVEQDDLSGVADACGDHLTTLLLEFGAESLPALVRDHATDTTRLLCAVMTNFEDMTVYVTDAHGGIIFSAGKSSATAPEEGTILLTEDYFAALRDRDAAKTSAETAARQDIFDAEPNTHLPSEHQGLFVEIPILQENGQTLLYATPIQDSAGSIVGHVLAASTSESTGSLMETTLQSVAVAGLWIMLAALIAIYFTTERIIGPLREMSRASKKLMVGQFDARVRVHGKDEVAELAVAFNQMAGALENLDRMRNSFVANVSHDLRTPMTTIAGFIDGILDGVIPPGEQEHYLRVVSEEVRRLSRLVTALLDVSRLQAGDRKFNPQPFDACEMGRQILISFEQKINAKQLDVAFDCDEDRMYVLADRDAIHQILYNICDNAVKFASEGGKLRMGFAYTEGEGHRHRKVSISVYNEGQGIPAEDLPFIFERFYKSDKSRSLDKTGVGLGMFIAKTIIEAHHETISVQSEYGHDCTFTFTLAPTEPPLSKSRISSEKSHM